jgi:hypothetical protein
MATRLAQRFSVLRNGSGGGFEPPLVALLLMAASTLSVGEPLDRDVAGSDAAAS